MKTFCKSLITLLSVCLAGSCDEEGKETDVTGITIVTPEKTTLEIDETLALSAYVTPQNATIRRYAWQSDRNNVATVSAAGVITAIAKGEAVISAITPRDGFKDEITITVLGPEIPVSSVELDKNALTLKEGGTGQFIVKITPDNATNKEVIWKSEDETVATVSQTGEVFAVAVGSTTVSVTSVSGNHEATATVAVISADIPITGVALNKTEIELLEGETEQMILIFTPADATNHQVTWNADDETVATVDDKGLIKAIAPGTTVITVTTDDGGHTASVTVTVKKAEGAAGTYTGSILMDNNALASNVPIVLKYESDTKVSVEASANLIIGGNIDLEGELDVSPDGEGGFVLNGNALTTAPALAPIPLPTVVEGTINPEGELYLHLIITGVSQKMEFKGKK
jgi:uncharacterized protein YjdB